MASPIRDVPGQKMYISCQKKRKESKNCEDLISSLTDDLLVHILSLLDLREAARTSTLSKRWRYVWANLSNLDFDASSTLFALWHARSISEEHFATEHEAEACKYVRRVTHVVSSSLAPSISRFRVHFPLGVLYESSIHTWVNFAMGKKVKELELNLSSFTGGCPQYPFYLDSFRCYAGYPSVSSLVSLSLVAVSISGYFLQSVLFNFPNLERLVMKNLYCGQSNLDVVGDLLKLRHLEISGCRDYGKLEVSARNLISIRYFGYKQEVKFSNVPMLDEATFGGHNAVRSIRSLHYSGFLPRLTKLTLSMLKIQDFIQNSIEFPHCGNLKQLEVNFSAVADYSLLVFTKLIDACPMLHTFKLQRGFGVHILWDDEALGGIVIKVAEKRHHCLRIFEMVGFRGTLVDIELVMYLARFAIVFEKVVLDPHLLYDEGKPSNRNTREQIEASRKQAKILRNQLPARVQMEVL